MEPQFDRLLIVEIETAPHLHDLRIYTSSNNAMSFFFLFKTIMGCPLHVFVIIVELFFFGHPVLYKDVSCLKIL